MFMTYEGEKEVRQFLLWVGKFDIYEFFRDTITRGKDAPALEWANLIDEADCLLCSFTDRKVFLVMTESHSCDTLSTLHTYIIQKLNKSVLLVYLVWRRK